MGVRVAGTVFVGVQMGVLGRGRGRQQRLGLRVQVAFFVAVGMVVAVAVPGGICLAAVYWHVHFQSCRFQVSG